MKTKNTPKRIHNPAHPGEVIRETCIEPLGLSVSAAAKGLGVTRKALSELLTGHSGVSANMAIRCQIASNRDPGIAPNNDPLVGVV